MTFKADKGSHLQGRFPIACVNLKSNAGFLEAFDIASIAAGPRDVLSVKCVRIGIEKLLFCPRVMPQEVRKGGEKASTEKRLKSKPAAQPIGSGNGRFDAGFAKRRMALSSSGRIHDHGRTCFVGDAQR
jgi:hypothetical protein